MSQKLLSIGKASEELGVHITTLRRWEREGKLEAIKTQGNHRRYRLDELQLLAGENSESEVQSDIVRVASYCRVSSYEQKNQGDLERQNGCVLKHCAQKGYRVVKSFEEVGSGMCDTRSKLQQLFKFVSNREVDKVVVENKDRLTRFNFNFLNQFFASHDVEIEWVNEVLGKSYEEELVEDILSLMSSFSNELREQKKAPQETS